MGFPILFPACVLSSWTGGAIAGVFATLIVAVGAAAAYHHLPPAGLAVTDSAHLLALCAIPETLAGPEAPMDLIAHRGALPLPTCSFVLLRARN